MESCLICSPESVFSLSYIFQVVYFYQEFFPQKLPIHGYPFKQTFAELPYLKCTTTEIILLHILLCYYYYTYGETLLQ